MKTILFLSLCCFCQLLYAQKKTKYVIEIDATKDEKYKPFRYEYGCYSCSYLSYNRSHHIPCKDTVFTIHINYSHGKEIYDKYYDYRTKQMECHEYDSDSIPNMPPDTVWLKKHVRHAIVHFDGNYSELEWEGYKAQNSIDSVNFIKAWPLFSQFLQQYENVEKISIHLNSDLVTKYLCQPFHLPQTITQLKKLELLNLYGDGERYPVSLPPEILQIKRLTSLGFYNDSYYTDLERLKNNKKIKYLRIQSIMITDGFPLWLYEMTNLRGLSLSCCFVKPGTKWDFVDMTTIPNGISKLKKLNHLGLGQIGCASGITHLPIEELCSMKKLESIDVYSGNFFKNKAQIEQLKKHLDTYYFNTFE